MAKNRKINWKRVIAIVCIVVIAISCLGLISSCFKKDTTKTISASAFSRGGLDENGEHVETKKSLVTEEAFDCIGLRVVPDFDAHITYDVYYYDYNDNLLEKKLDLKKTYDEDFPLAKTCRIVIHPEGSEKKDFEIGYFDVRDIAKKLTITVDKNQDYKYADSMNMYGVATIDKSFQPLNNGAVADFDSSNLVDYSSANNKVKVSNKVVVDGSYDYYDVFVHLDVGEAMWPITALFGADGKVIRVNKDYIYDFVDSSIVVKPAWVKMTIEVPVLDSYDGVHLMVSMPDDSNCYIFGYND